MLTLGRKTGESVVITVPPSTTPTRVWVTLKEVDRAHVRLGFQAPDEVIVNRQEVDAKIREVPPTEKGEPCKPN